MEQKLEVKILALRDSALELAKEALQCKKPQYFRGLNEISEQLSMLASSSEEDTTHPQRLQVFKRYRGDLFTAEFDISRGTHCVIIQGQWMTPSRAAMTITGSNVNGWRFWHYKRRDGSIHTIEELRG